MALVLHIRPSLFCSTDCFQYAAWGGERSGDLEHFTWTSGAQLLNQSRVKHIIIHRSRLATVGSIDHATCVICLSSDWAWLQVASRMSMGLGKHQIIGFPATSERWHEYSISSFHKVHYNLLLSCYKLTPQLIAVVRVSKTNRSVVIAYSGARDNDCSTWPNNSNCAFCNFIGCIKIPLEIHMKYLDLSCQILEAISAWRGTERAWLMRP